MSLKKYLLLILTITAFGCKSFKTESASFSSEKLCGEWLYLGSYDETLTKIDTLKKEVKKSGFVPSITYEESGNYTSFNGDYIDNGTFTFDAKNGILIHYYSEGKTKKESKTRVTYLDDQYLLFVAFENIKESTATFFYKKK